MHYQHPYDTINTILPPDLMKFSHFVLSLLTVCAVQADVIVSPGYERIDVTTGEDFKVEINGSATYSYGNNAYAFVLGNDTEWVTDAIKEKDSPMRDGSVYITSDSDAPASFSATGLTKGRIVRAASSTGITVNTTYTWTGLKNVNISNNTATGAISFNSNVHVFGVIGGNYSNQKYAFTNNAGTVTFSGNTAKYTASKTSATACGSVISAIGSSSVITIDNNAGGVSITDNLVKMSYSSAANGAVAYGGALYAKDGKISISGNRGLVDLSSNTVENNRSVALGGLALIRAASTTSTDRILEISKNTAGVQINDNTANSTRSANTTNWLAAGGAISSLNCDNVGVKVQNNEGRVSISGNKAITTGAGACGGAISVGYVDISGNDGFLEILNNYTESTISETGTSKDAFKNTLSSKGGAFHVTRNDTSKVFTEAALRISGNGNVTISGNHADAKAGSAGGGVVFASGYLDKVEISNNGHVNINGNYASAVDHARGGAIYTGSGVFIENNDDVCLAGNYERSIDTETGAATYRLRSIYQDCTTTPASAAVQEVVQEYSQFRLMAAKGKSIEIQDSIYSNYKGIDVIFNGDYTTENGETVKGEGTIRFSGKNTVSALQKLKGEEAVTDAEIAASRTSEFASMVRLMGGRLELAEAVYLKGVGFNAAENSGAVLSLENASTLQQNGAVTFNAGTTLEVTGSSNTLTANSLSMADNSTMKFVLTRDALSSAMLTLDVMDGLTMDTFSNITIELANPLTVGEGTYHLLSLTNPGDFTPETDWDESTVTLTSSANAQLFWEGCNLFVTVIPEPATATLSLLALTMLAGRRRK